MWQKMMTTKGIFHDSKRSGICEKSMELGAFVQKLWQFKSEYSRKDQHKQRGFKMLVVFGKRTSKEGHKNVLFYCWVIFEIVVCWKKSCIKSHQQIRIQGIEV
jgi:hypothetical protein